MRKLRDKILQRFGIHLKDFYVGLILSCYVLVGVFYENIMLGFLMLGLVIHYKIK